LKSLIEVFDPISNQIWVISKKSHVYLIFLGIYQVYLISRFISLISDSFQSFRKWNLLKLWSRNKN